MEEVIRAGFAHGTLHVLNLASNVHGFQASSRNSRGPQSYGVGDSADDPALALLEAMKPLHGHSWAEVVGAGTLAKKLDRWWAERAAAEEEPDLAEDIL